MFFSSTTNWSNPLGEAPTPNVDVMVSTDDNTVTVALRDHDGRVPTGNLAALTRGSEDPLEHPRRIELWPLRWVVFHTKVTSPSGWTTPRRRMQMPVCDE